MITEKMKKINQVFNGTDLDMVMDKVVKGLKFSQSVLIGSYGKHLRSWGKATMVDISSCGSLVKKVHTFQMKNYLSIQK